MSKARAQDVGHVVGHGIRGEVVEVAIHAGGQPRRLPTLEAPVVLGRLHQGRLAKEVLEHRSAIGLRCGHAAATHAFHVL